MLQITEKGRVCYKYCPVYKKTGDCPVPEESVFAEVLQGGNIGIGDEIDLAIPPDLL